MKVKINNLIIGVLTFIFLYLLAINTYARTYQFDSYDVDIEVLEDSRMIIEETITYRFNGTYRGVFRDITLTDQKNLKKCQSDPSLQCGGFDTINILEVRDTNDRILNHGDYTVENHYDEYSGENRMKIIWQFSEDGIDFNNETYKFYIKYEIIGGIGFFDEYDLFYWNVLPPDRDETIEKSTIEIQLPDKMPFKKQGLEILTTYGTLSEYVYNDQDNKLTIYADNIIQDEEFTINWMLQKGLLTEPGKIIVNRPGISNLAPMDINYFVNGTERNSYLDSEEMKDVISYVTPGQVIFRASRFGYLDYETNLDIKSGEIKEIDVILKPSPIMLISNILVCILSLFGIILLPLGIFWIFMLWRRKGTDKIIKSTVVPEYDPPENLPPYLIGSLKDEKVDLRDITSVIIDLASRGYIKIIEIQSKMPFGKKTYEFQKLKDFENLTISEKEITRAIFKDKNRTTTKDMENTFYTKVPKIKKAIYNEMQERNYFLKRPDKVRQRYVFFSIMIIILSIFGLGVINVFVSAITGTPFLLATIQCSSVIIGLILFPFAFIMPAKTKIGSELWRRFKGFKMFLYHVERYRLEKLQPETFERYLSYAMVFGIEKRWAEQFKDIYQGKPSWFEGKGDFTTFHLINTLNNMHSTTTHAMTSTPSSSGSGFSSSGGGFSGGFSGGGGGGGGAGAF